MCGPNCIYYINRILFKSLLIDRIVKTIKILYLYMSSKTNLHCLKKMSTKVNWLSNVKGKCILEDQKREQIVLKSHKF